jgi:transposase
VLLVCLDAEIVGAEAKLAQLLPDTPFAPLTTVPGWGTGRAANYGAALGDLDRWPGASQLIAPLVCRPRSMTRPGSVGTAASAARAVQLRWIDLGIGMWHADPAARPRGASVMP